MKNELDIFSLLYLILYLMLNVNLILIEMIKL